MPFLKGICYGNDAFPAPYDPSTANNSCPTYGSDPTYAATKPLWGSQFNSKSGTRYGGRNDLQTIKNMGGNAIRLYDWDGRNDHFDFLNTCQGLGIKVLVGASSYNLQPGGGYPNREANIPVLIKSLGNAPMSGTPTDYHPAIYALIFGNEPELEGFSATECIQFTKDWVRIENAMFSSFRKLPIGHPVDFGKYGGQYPCWGFWDPLLAGLGDIKSRLILCPQPQNDATYLFDNAESSGKGYVDLTYERYGLPLLFTEIGVYRGSSAGYLDVVEQQLRRSIAYGAANPSKLLGCSYFQFADKVWLCPTGGNMCPSEGSWGAHAHSSTIISRVKYVPQDFTHFDTGPCENQTLDVDQLSQNPVYARIVGAYTGSVSAPGR
jgi:hypothetical protein